jgi:hypothetical protein
VLQALKLPDRPIGQGTGLSVCLKSFLPEGEELTYGDVACLLAIHVGVATLLMAPTLAGIFDFWQPVGPSALNPGARQSRTLALALAALLPVEAMVVAPLVAAWVYGRATTPVAIPSVRHGETIVRAAGFAGALGALWATQATLAALSDRLMPQADGPEGSPVPNAYYIQAGAIMCCLCLPLFAVGTWCISRHMAAGVLGIVGQDEGFGPLSQTMAEEASV